MDRNYDFFVIKWYALIIENGFRHIIRERKIDFTVTIVGGTYLSEDVYVCAMRHAAALRAAWPIALLSGVPAAYEPLWPAFLAARSTWLTKLSPRPGLYRRAYVQLRKMPKPIGAHSPGYIAETDEQARDELWPHYKQMRDRIGGERGWPPMARAEFGREADGGSLYRQVVAFGLAVGGKRGCAPSPP
jgi:hypothetical protein